jgi:hypothetical protein
MMAEEAKEPIKKEVASAAGETKKLKKKKSRPSNCAQSNKRIRRKDWYYRDGKYFANKQCFKLFAEQAAEKAGKAKEAAKAAAVSAGAEAKPAGE